MRRAELTMTVGLAMLTITAAYGDQVVTATDNFTAAQIVTFEQGQIKFRASDGKIHSLWPHEAKLLIVDRAGWFEDFNQAERFLQSGAYDRSIVRYQRVLRLCEDFWADLVAARMLLACDRAKQLDDAVRYFILVLRGRHGGPAAAARLLPTAIPTRLDTRAGKALAHIDGALVSNPRAPEHALLVLLRYEILRRVGDDRAHRMAPKAAAVVIPSSARSSELFRIQLTAMTAALAGEVPADAFAHLDRAIRDCPEALLADFLLLKGEASLKIASSREDLLRAGWSFLRVAIHFPDTAQAPAGLYGAARALHRARLKDKALGLLDECLEHSQLTTEFRGMVESARRQWSGKTTSSGEDP